MKILSKKDKVKSFGNSFYFGDYGEVDLGISVTEITSPADLYQDTKHYHKESTEYYLILQGEATFEVVGEPIKVGQQQTLMVEAGESHWLVKVDKTPCTIISIASKKLQEDKILVK